ncbi:MAG: transposase [Pseudomonadota bacterium]
MARPLRIEFEGALYHVTARGNERRDIFFQDEDREMFLKILEKVIHRFNWYCYAYCLMDNHYHLLIETPDSNLSKGMRQLNGIYTQYINRTHHRVGHLYQGRFKAILVEKDAYLLELSRYIVLNPVRAGLVKHAEEWHWSSYRETIGLKKQSEWLMTDKVLSNFGTTKPAAQEQFISFVLNGVKQESIWNALRGQLFLGSESFIEETQKHIREDQSLHEIPLQQKQLQAKELSYYAANYANKTKAMVEAYRSGGYSLQEVGVYFGVGRMTVSRAVKKFEESVKWET